METKDWITMLVPIIFNGIFLVIFEKILEVKANKKVAKESKKQLVKAEYFRLLIESKQKFIDMTLSMNGIAKEKEVKDAMNNFCESLNLLHKYTTCYEPILIREKIGVDKIMNLYRQLILGIDRITRIPWSDLEELNQFANEEIMEIKEHLDKLVEDYFKA